MRPLARLYRWILSHELATLVLLGVIAGGSWGFVSIADEVMEGDSRRFDEQILLSMRAPGDLADPIGPSWVEELARDVTALGSVVVLMIFAATMVIYLALTKQTWVAVFVAIAVLSGTGVSTLMKSGFDRPRPDLVPHETRIYTRSFPSGHSSMSAIIYLTLGAVMARADHGRKTKAFLILVPVFLMVIVGVSRVYLGVHWPTDVLAGWALGTTWAAASWLVFNYLKRRYALPVDDIHA